MQGGVLLVLTRRATGNLAPKAISQRQAAGVGTGDLVPLLACHLATGTLLTLRAL